MTQYPWVLHEYLAAGQGDHGSPYANPPKLQHSTGKQRSGPQLPVEMGGMMCGEQRAGRQQQQQGEVQEY